MHAHALDKTIGRLTLRVSECAAALGISRSNCYEKVKTGEIPSIQIGERILIPVDALRQQIAEKLAQQRGGAGAA